MRARIYQSGLPLVGSWPCLSVTVLVDVGIRLLLLVGACFELCLAFGRSGSTTTVYENAFRK